MRESKSPHSSSICCVTKANGKWCIVLNAYNTLNTAQTPILRNNVLQRDMVGCTMYSALDLVDDYYQLLMRTSDIQLSNG